MKHLALLVALATPLLAGCSEETPYSEREQAFLEIAEVPEGDELSAIEMGKSICTIYESVELASERHRLIYQGSELVLDRELEQLQRIEIAALAELCPGAAT